MADNDFRAQLLLAARAVASLDVKVRGARKRLADLEALRGEANRHLRRLTEATEPYVPPTPEETRAAAARAQEHE